MPKGQIRFVPLGGSGTTLTLDNGTESDSATQQPAQTGLSVSIETDRTEAKNISPAGFMFKATASGFSSVDQYQRDLRFKWSFNDPDAITLTALRADRFDRFGWRDSNVAYLNHACHVFAPTKARYNGAASRTYNVTCTVTDRQGNSAQDSINVTVHNPDVEFAGALTKLVAPDNDFSAISAEYPNAEQYTSYMDAWFACTSTGGRILLKRGHTYVNSSSIANRQKFQVDAWGTGAAPIFDIVAGGGAFTFAENVVQASICNVDFEGDWDVATESSPTNTLKGSPFSWQSKSDEHWHTVYNCNSRNLNDMGFHIAGGRNTVQQRHVYVTNYLVDGFRNYGSLINTTHRFGMVGVSMRQKPTAMQGGGLKTETNSHGPLRFAGPQDDSWNVFDGIDGLTAQSWSGGGSYEDFTSFYDPAAADRGASSIPGIQPFTRWNVGQDKTYAAPAPLRVSRAVMEGGNTVFVGSTNGAPPATADMQLDKAIIICGSTAPQGVGFGHKGLWVSNVLTIVPKMALSRNKTWDPILNAAGTSSNPSRIWGCTTLMWLNRSTDGLNQEIQDVDGHTSTEQVYNNVYHAPNLNTPVDNSANLDLTERLFAPLWPGMRFFFYAGKNAVSPYTPHGKIGTEPYINTAYEAKDTFNGQDSVCLPVPTGTGLRLSGANDPIPVDDMFGNVRPLGTLAHKGAIEPTSV